MFERLIRFVASASPDDLAILKLQDAALCQYWRQSPAAAAQPGLAARVEAALTRWMRGEFPQEAGTEGRRQQWLLRDVLDQLTQEPPEEWSPDLARYLVIAADLAETRGLAERLAPLTKPLREPLAERAAVQDRSTPLHALHGRVIYLTPQELMRAPAGKVDSFRGIKVSRAGPLFRASNHVRLLGDLPFDCILIVEHGVCAVDGFLLGTVLAAQNCEVRENIGGMVIAAEGDVRCRGIIDRAVVLAKGGSVCCRHAHSPERVCARKSIRVQGKALRGSYYAHTLVAGAEVRGAHVEVTGLLEAPILGAAGEEPLEIVLRRELTCEDYGQLLSGDARRALGEAFRRRDAVQYYTGLADAATLEAERQAEIALMYLFGGGLGQKRLDELIGMQRRLNMLDRIHRNLRRLIDHTEGRLLRGVAGVEVEETVEEVDEEAVDPALAGELETLDRLGKQVQSASDRSHLWAVMLDLRRNVDRVDHERAQLLREIQVRERDLVVSGPFDELRSVSDKAASKLRILQRVLPIVQQQSASGLIERINAPFFQRTLALIERRVALSQRYNGLALRAAQVFQEMAEDLRNAHNVEVGGQGIENRETPRVYGRFDGGVKVFFDLYTSEGFRRPAGSHIEIDAPEAAPRMIRLDDAIDPQ